MFNWKMFKTEESRGSYNEAHEHEVYDFDRIEQSLKEKAHTDIDEEHTRMDDKAIDDADFDEVSLDESTLRKSAKSSKKSTIKITVHYKKNKWFFMNDDKRYALPSADSGSFNLYEDTYRISLNDENEFVLIDKDDKAITSIKTGTEYIYYLDIYV